MKLPRPGKPKQKSPRSLGTRPLQYEIYDGQTLVDTVTVDQQQAPAADYTAGGESFEIIAIDVAIASDTLRVRILIQAPGTGSSNYRTLSADAVRIALVPEGPNGCTGIC